LAIADHVDVFLHFIECFLTSFFLSFFLYFCLKIKTEVMGEYLKAKPFCCLLNEASVEGLDYG